MRQHTSLWVVLGIAALPILCFVPIAFSTHQRMAEFRAQIVPGMTVVELHRFAGTPSEVLRRGEPLQAARRYYEVPALDEHTEVHFYPEEGLPYFNVYVFIDTRRGTVIRSDIENLFW